MIRKVKPMEVFYYDGKTMQKANIRELSPDRSYVISFIGRSVKPSVDASKYEGTEVFHVEEHVSRSDLFEVLRVKSAGRDSVHAIIFPQAVYREMFRMTACINRTVEVSA